MFSWDSLAFSMIQWVLAIWGSSAFSKTGLNIWKFTVHVLLLPGLENFEHSFTSVWDECNFAVVWAFFGIAFLWDWNEDWPFLVLWPLLSLWSSPQSNFRTFLLPPPPNPTPITSHFSFITSSTSSRASRNYWYILSGFAKSGGSIWMESYNTWSFVIDFFHLA